MSGEATLAGVAAVLKVIYKGGVPAANFKNFKYYSLVGKVEDDSGDNYVFGMQTEDTQGVSSQAAVAYANQNQSQYTRFTVTPTTLYSFASITGDAMQRAKGAGAMLELWKRETANAARSATKSLEVYLPRFGNAVLGTLNGGSVAGTTLALETPSDAANFDVNGTYNAVSDLTLSPTVRSGGAGFLKITKIDRLNGILTFGVTVNSGSGISDIGVSDSLVRIGTAATGGVAQVITGVQGWVQGSAGATIFGCDTSVDTVRLAGQVLDVTGVGMEDALIEAEANLNAQGYQIGDLSAMCHPQDLKELKKSLTGKERFDKMTAKSADGKLSFPALEFEGDTGSIALVSNPFCPRGELQLLDMTAIKLRSAEPAPHLQDYNGLPFERVPGTDKWQVAFAAYASAVVEEAYKCIRLTNWGVE
jgi:hypothetical protein